jgi:hypothetical protein
MSFIDLMANDVWSEADMTRRTEAMIRSEFSQEAETIINRKLLGAQMGTYAPTLADMQEMERYAVVAQGAQAAGLAARANMALLRRVFVMEEAQRRLDRVSLEAAWAIIQAPPIEPVVDEATGEISNADEIAFDEQARASAQLLVEPYTIMIDGEPEIDPAAIESDEAERAAAQAVIDTESDDAKALFETRRGV